MRNTLISRQILFLMHSTVVVVYKIKVINKTTTTSLTNVILKNKKYKCV